MYVLIVLRCIYIFLDCLLHTQSGSTTPLHRAAEKGHYDIVAVLLSYNADGTIKDQV